MALAALDVRVLAKQREACQVMIEEHVVFPGRFVMAIVAVDAERLLVRIVAFMAAQAICLQRDVKNRFNVAGRAFRIGMSAV